MEKNQVDTVKNVAIIVLVLIIVLGGAFVVTEVHNRGSNNNDSDIDDTFNLGEFDGNTTVLDATTEASELNEDEKRPHNYISIEEYLNLINARESSIVYIARPGCGFCNIANPILQHIAFVHDLTINYINTSELSDTEMIDLVNSDEYLRNGFGTPLILVVRNGRIVDSFPGLATISGYTEFFRENDLI